MEIAKMRLQTVVGTESGLSVAVKVRLGSEYQHCKSFNY